MGSNSFENKGRTENQVKNKFYWPKRKGAIISPSIQGTEVDSNFKREEFIEVSRNLEIYPKEDDIDRFLWYSRVHLSTQSLLDTTYQDSFQDVNFDKIY